MNNQEPVFSGWRTRVVLLLTLLTVSFPASPQLTTASLEGMVRDPTGAVISGARVQVTNTATNAAIELTTDSGGRFLAPSLPPGPYEITVQAAGFKKLQRSGIVLDVNQALSLELALELGTATETVEVVAAAALLDSTTSEMGLVVDNRSIINLPLNERNSWSLVFLAPGVTGSVGDKYNNTNISINGGRPGSAGLMVDGIPSATPLSNPIGGFTIFPSVDSIQEFKVETTNYSAEFGRSGSGIINLIYKTGTNQLHGSAFEFLRNSKLDANNFFSNRLGVGLPSFKRNQFGGTVAGPAYMPRLYDGRNKTFFLFGYEGLRQSSANNLTNTVPTALQRMGDFSQTRNAAGVPVVIYDPATTLASGSGFMRQAFPGNIIPASRFDPVAANVMKYYPLPNAAGNPHTGANNFFVAAASPENIYNIDAKVDENLNDRSRFFIRASRRVDATTPPDYVRGAIGIAQGGVAITDSFTNGALDYTYNVSPTFLIDMRYGYGRSTENRAPRSQGFDPVQLGLPAYMRDANAIMFPGFQLSNYLTLGNGFSSQWGPAAYDTHSLGVNNIKVMNRHLIKFGFDWLVMQANVEQGLNLDGGFTFDQAFTQGPNPNQASTTAGNSLASFLLGTGNGSLILNNRFNATTSKYYAWYIADDWKVSDKLTLNIGFRYGLDQSFTERYNRMNVFDPAVTSPLAATAGLPGLKGGLEFLGVGGYGRRILPTDLNGWDPRFGFAYHLSKNTVLRGGAGIFHAPSLRDAQSANSNTGFSSTSSFISAANGVTPTNFLQNPFPGGLLPLTGSSRGLLTGIGVPLTALIAGDYRIPYTENWNFNVQQQLPGNVLVEAGYVGGHSLHLSYSNYNLNQLHASQLSNQLQQQVRNPFFGLITGGPLSTATVPYSALAAPFPQYTTIALQFPSGSSSIYQSFQLKIQKRFNSGLSFMLSYTTQKLIDDNSAIAVIGANAADQDIYNRRGDRSVSANDISQIFVLSYVYELPFGKGKRFGSHWNRPVDAVLGGWQLNGIVTLQTGLPLALTTQNTSGSGSAVLRPNNNGQSGALSGSVEGRLNKYFNTSAFSQPAPFTFGNTGRTLPDVRAPGVRNTDFSLFKNFHLKEWLSLQFRAEAFNLLNSVQFAAPNTSLNSTQFGIISTQINSPRQVQFGVKLLF